MTLDVHTLFLVTIYVEAILGLLLLFVWAQNMALRAGCWWGFAHLIRLVSIWLFGRYGAVPDLVLTLPTRCYSPPSPRPGPAHVAVLWLLLCRLPNLAYNINLRSLIASGIISGYL
jgi:hypothetical protein